MLTLFETGIERTAIFDPTGAYRFLLTRSWNPAKPRICRVMLNPSDASDKYDDPTIKQCISFSQAWNFGGFDAVNFFAYKSPYPKILRQVPDPVGADNDNYIREASGRASMIICAWGAGGALFGRDLEVIPILQEFGELYCIGTTKDGHPWHPLRKSLELQPILYAPGVM